MPRIYVRKFDWSKARLLRGEGLTYTEIAARFGVSRRAVRLAIDDVERERAARLRQDWQRKGVCVTCGGPCSFNSSDPERHNHRCVQCVRGKVHA